ncbi:hypothetical protein [Botrimarina hoheduenensis]|uniref:hypothetical protein n=1 Tax=Botrimarina hoheduenensis TaxID=2528000 RepID=UPI001E301153|nr:hypothetical protein [Botrimarina hoheduenensis]
MNKEFTPNVKARRDFGTAVHQDLPQHLKEQYPDSVFETFVGPGQSGPDARWVDGVDPGFDIAELKPKTDSGFRAFENQIGQYPERRAGLFGYDPATGDIEFGGVFE